MYLLNSLPILVINCKISSDENMNYFSSEFRGITLYMKRVKETGIQI